MRRPIAAAVLALPLTLAVAAPAGATTTSPPVASEPPGGATCAPGIPGCGQDTGASPTPTPTGSARPTPAPTPASSRGTTSLPSTGTLPRTGPDGAVPLGVVAAGLLGTGALLLVAGRRRTG